MICVPTKFEVATFNGLGGDAFAKKTKVTDGLTDDDPKLVL